MKQKKPLPEGIIHLGSEIFKGRCQQCRKKKDDLSKYRERYICRDCLCPTYDPMMMAMAYLSMKATSQKWGGL